MDTNKGLEALIALLRSQGKLDIKSCGDTICHRPAMHEGGFHGDGDTHYRCNAHAGQLHWSDPLEDARLIEALTPWLV